MKCRNKCGLVLMFVGLASVSIQGCVRLNLETRESCIGVPEAPPFEEQTELKHEIMVSRFGDPTNNTENDTKITVKQVDRIFDHATNVIRCGEVNKDAAECAQFDDAQGDFACKVTLERKGSGQALPPGTEESIPTFKLPLRPPPTQPALTQGDINLDCTRDGEICSSFDLHAVWNADQMEGIKVVNNVKYCDGIWEVHPVTGTLGPTLIGCAQLPGRAMAVERIQSESVESLLSESVESLLWSHEYGHAKGLYHPAEQACVFNDDPKALMSPEIGISNTKLNGQECFGFRGGQP